MAGGLIPAHAGKTSRNPFVQAARRAHPRSRGENLVVSLEECVPVGSSPLTRGKRQQDVAVQDLEGLIPAHAGKTIHIPPSRRIRGAHPRSRGENLEDNWEVLEADGSSPLTRGKLRRPEERGGGPGLIPAHAGKTRG